MSRDLRLQSDDVPGWFHQWRVNRNAKRLLRRLCANDSNQARVLFSTFETDPGWGLEVVDEAMVLLKNSPSTWSIPHAGMVLLGTNYEALYDRVVVLRGGREHHTTTPTLRGGGKRLSVPCDFCTGKFGRKRTFCTSDEMRTMAARGLEPNDSSIAWLIQKGLSRKEAIAKWRLELIEPATEIWRLCSRCEFKCRPFAKREV